MMVIIYSNTVRVTEHSCQIHSISHIEGLLLADDWCVRNLEMFKVSFALCLEIVIISFSGCR